MSRTAARKVKRREAQNLTKAQRFRKKFSILVQKYGMQNDQDATNLLTVTECWLDETNNKPGDLHISATLPSLARLIEKITDPQASQAFQGLLSEMEELRNNNADLTETVAALEKEVGALRGQTEQLEGRLSTREAMRATLEKEVGALRGQIEQLEGRLSVCEAMRALEHWIAVQVVGSKNRVRDEGLYTVKELLNSRDYSQTLLQVCDRVHCNALTFLKKQGDTTAHHAASKDRLAQSINESDDTPEHKKVASDLVEMLDRFCMKEDKTFGWDPLATEAQNMKRLQLPVAVNASVQNAG